MLQFLYGPGATGPSEPPPPVPPNPWLVRLLLWPLLLLLAGLSGGAVYSGLWLVAALPTAPYGPLLALIGLCLVLNGLTVRSYARQPPLVAAGALVVSALATWLVLRAVLLCAFLFLFFFA